MSTYNTKLYSPTAFKRAIIFENQRINHLGVDLNQIHQILLDEDTSTLDANIHYSQVYDEESLKKPSFLKFSESSPFYDVNEFDEEIKINECNLKPQAHTLFYENPEKVIAQENLNVPEIERVLRTKTFHDNSIEEESIGTATSPCFETLRIGTIGKSDQILEQKIDINAQISQIRMNSILKNASLDHPGGINYINNHYLPENISDRIEMTNRSSYRSLSQLEQFSKHTEISKTNIANFSDFLNVKEKNSGTGTMKSNISEEENNDIYSKVTYYLQENEKKDQILVHKNILHGDTINIKHTLNNNEVFTPQKHQKENSFGFNDLEEKLKIINETIHSKNLENNEKMILQKRNKEEVLIESKNIDEELKKITEIHEKTNQKSFSNKIEFVNIENNEITSQSEQYEINENPIVFSNSDNKILTNFDNNTTKTMQKITENELIEKESDEKKFKNLTFFLNLEKKIKEDANKLRNDQILKNTTKSENSTTFNPSHLNIKNQKEEENKKYETNEKNMQVSETNKNFTTNVNVQNYSNNTKENINRDNKSIHMSKIADSFKDIAATITETINKHKIQIEKDCDLSIFKNFLHKVREQSNERISRKYAIAENSINYEPNEKKPSNNNKEMPEFYHCINSNIQSVQRENPKYISDKIDQSNL